MSTIRTATKIPFTAHTLRHTYLSHLARNGADIYKIQKIAGHSSILTTSLYLHCSNRELAETAGLVCNIVG
ncbi:MAG: site-specific integrase [Candidatus Peribacteria bacterium]|nr:site-specific integrase [Candidatus Peribacteria bacterium]